jgi:hypothetical protein
VIQFFIVSFQLKVFSFQQGTVSGFRFPLSAFRNQDKGGINDSVG